MKWYYFLYEPEFDPIKKEYIHHNLDYSEEYCEKEFDEFISSLSEDNPSDTVLNLKKICRGIFLGKTRKPERLAHILSKHLITFIPEELGKKLEQYGIHSFGVFCGCGGRQFDLSDDEKEELKKVIRKLQVRKLIEANIGDIYDIVADLSKRIDLIERLVLRVCYSLFKEGKISDEIKEKYLPLIEQILSKIDSGELKTVSDILDTNEIVGKISSRMNLLAQILEDRYFRSSSVEIFEDIDDVPGVLEKIEEAQE